MPYNKQELQPHNIKKFTIHSNEGSTLSFTGNRAFNQVIIYQSIFDDSIRVSAQVADTGSRGASLEEQDDLNLTTGEKVELVVNDNTPNKQELAFEGANELCLEYASSNSSTTMVELENLHLCHPDVIKNELESSYVVQCYEGKISDIVSKLLKENLGTEKECYADPTLNTLPISGKNEKPLDICTLLATKAVPESSDQLAGYFFWQDYQGYKFKSIDTLFAQNPKRKMIYNQSQYLPPSYTNKILDAAFSNNLSLIENLRMGSLSQTKIRTFDPYTNQYVTNVYSGEDTYNESNNAMSVPPKFGTFMGLSENSSRIINQIYNTGIRPPGSTLDTQLETAKETTFNIDEIVRKSMSRFRQSVLFKATIKIYGDFTIFPGDTIECVFPEVSSKDLRLAPSKKKSGKYLVTDVAHLINAEHCFTKLNIVRDSIAE